MSKKSKALRRRVFQAAPAPAVTPGSRVRIVNLERDPRLKKRRRRRMSESRALKIGAPNRFEEAIEAEADSYKTFQTLNPEMLTESRDPNTWPKVVDRFTGKECHVRISRISWLERGHIMRKGALVESTRRRRFDVGSFRESFAKASTFFGRAKTSLRESRTFDKLKEGGMFDFDGGFMPGPTGWPGVDGVQNGVFVPFPPGPLTRQLYLQDQWEQMGRATQMYNHYDMIHGAIEMIAAFTIGDGVRIASIGKNSDNAQVVWDEFDDRVDLQEGLPEECMQGSVNGELLWHTPETLVAGRPGYVDFVSKDPGTCWEIITEPDDIRKVISYYFNYPTRYMIVTEDNIPTTEYIVEMLPPDEMIHIKFNVQKNEARGRSDIFSILSDAKMLQDLNRARVIKVMNAASVVLDHTITGDDFDVDNIRSQKIGAGWGGAGTEYFHNESEKIEVHKGADSENSKSGLHDEVVGQIATGIGLSSDYLSTAGGGSRASALTRTEPVAKMIRKKQKKYEHKLKKLYKRVIQVAKKYGRLPADTSEKCEITLPEIAPENVKEVLGNIALAEQQEWITHEQAMNMAQKVLDITDSADYDTTMKIIIAFKQWRLKNDPQLAAVMNTPLTFNPETGQPMPTAAKPGQPGAKPGQPGASPSSQQNPNAAGKDKSKNTYNGDKMGMSNDTKRGIKTALQAQRDRHPILGHREAKGGGHRAHKAMHRGLRSRTKHTIMALAEETISGSSMGATARKMVSPESIKLEAARMKKLGFQSVLGKHALETAPPGWEPTVKKMKGQPGIDNPFALAWWMNGQGYVPGGKGGK